MSADMQELNGDKCSKYWNIDKKIARTAITGNKISKIWHTFYAQTPQM